MAYISLEIHLLTEGRSFLAHLFVRVSDREFPNDNFIIKIGDLNVALKSELVKAIDRDMQIVEVKKGKSGKIKVTGFNFSF